jgi:hypothetical protein
MKRENLIETAMQIKQPSIDAYNEFSSKLDILVSEMNKFMLERNDLKSLIGEGNAKMMEDNHRNHARFMQSIFRNHIPEVLVDTVLWVYRAYRSHGFNLTYWPAQLDTWLIVYKNHLSENTYNEIYPFYYWMLINQAAFVKISDQMLNNFDTPKHSF